MSEDSSEQNAITNKGVNVNSVSSPVAVHRYPETESSLSMDVSPKSMSKIKQELQTVLDLMGPSTPTLTVNTTTLQTSDADADNEESSFSMQLSRQTAKKSKSSKKSSANSKSSESRLFSKNTDTFNKDSVLADYGTSSFYENESPLEIKNPILGYEKECHCIYYNNKMSGLCEDKPSSKSMGPITVDTKKTGVLEWIKSKSFDLIMKNKQTSPCDLYKLNICECDGGLPKKVVFDLVDGIPKPSSTTVATNTLRNPIEKFETLDSADLINEKNRKNTANETITHIGPQKFQKSVYYDSDGNARVDFYYFDHGNAQYFHTTDTPPVMKCEIVAQKTERYTTRFWAEFFASIHIFLSFAISFVLQLFKFLLYGFFRPLCVGILQMGSDYFFKPFLTTLFNGLIQPFLIFLYNVATSVRDLCDPIAEAGGYFCRELAVLFRSIRLCSYRKNTSDDTNCDCRKEKRCEC